MDEALRVDLKMRRDSEVRGHENKKDDIQAIVERKNQYELFVEPQKNEANLLIHLSSISIAPFRLSVSIRTPNQSLVREICRVVNSLSSVPSNLERTEDDELWLRVESDALTSEENFELLSKLVPKYEKLLTEMRILNSGTSGCISVACLAALASQRTHKYANS